MGMLNAMETFPFKIEMQSLKSYQVINSKLIPQPLQQMLLISLFPCLSSNNFEINIIKKLGLLKQREKILLIDKATQKQQA